MKKSDINPMPQFFDRFINLVTDVELREAFVDSVRQLNELDRDLLTSLGDRKYAPDKWTVKEVFQHVIDFERIFTYRVLLFARREGSIPQSVEGDLIASNSQAGRRTIDELMEELIVVRLATRSLYDSFSDETLLNKGTNWKYEISVLAMGFNIIGHQIHHLKVIEEKYVPLLHEGKAVKRIPLNAGSVLRT
jgi:DinB superfamily